LSVRSAILIILSMIALPLTTTGVGIWLIGWFVVDWLYPVLFEVLQDGRTPGKRAMGLRVVHDDLSPIGWNASLIRNLLRTVDFLPAGYVLGLTSMCMTPAFQRLGDLAAGTLVIYRSKVTDSSRLPDVAVMTPPPGLDQDERQALINFARRDAQLSEGRKVELAAILVPLNGPQDERSVSYWQGVGISLMGHK